MAVRFDIAEAEWPPLAQGPRAGFADHVAPIHFAGKVRQMALRAVPLVRDFVLLYGRDLEHDPHGSWVVGNDFEHHLSPHWLDVNRNYPLSVRLQEAVKSLELGEIGRLFRWNREARAEAAFWRADGRGCWRGFGFLGNEECVEFDIALATPLLQMSWKQAHQAFVDQMADPNSSPAFALRWADLPRQEQLDFALRFKRGDKAGFERVLRAACLCESLVIKRGGRWRWNIGMGQPFPSHALYWFSPSAISTGGDFVPISPFLTRCFQAVWNFFCPFNDEALLQKHSCIDIRYTSSVSELWIEPEAASAHERMEAALFLREWLQDHAPPEQRDDWCREPLT